MNARRLEVLSAHPGISVQDTGRPGLRGGGVSAGGAVDPVALAEASALLGEPPQAAVEMAGAGGRFRAGGGPVLVALTGAEMRAEIDGQRLVWPGTHVIADGAVLKIGQALRGTYGYLTPAGGIATAPRMGSRSAHLTAGIGAALAAGDALPLGPDPGAARAGLTLAPQDRFGPATLRILPGMQTDAFGATEVARLETETFTKDARANRQGARLAPEGEGLHAEGALGVTSEAIVPGDIQVVGAGAAGGGTPFVLLAECQTTGGYPRIGTVISADLPRVAQAPPGTPFRFRFVSLEDALGARAEARASAEALPRRIVPLVRDPREMPDLLSYSLIDGVTSGEPGFEEGA